MISINFKLAWPTKTRDGDQKDFFYWDKRITKNKAFSIQISRFFAFFSFVEFDFRWTIREDHAGMHLELGLLGHSIILNMYDVRHWDSENGKWEEYNLGE